MAWRQHLDFAPVPFVKEKNDEWSSKTHPTGHHDEKTNQMSPEDGKKVKSFYEELVGLKGSRIEEREVSSPKCSSSSPTRTKKSSTRKRKTSVDEPHDTKRRDKGVQIRKQLDTDDTVVSRFLKAAQMGDMKAIKREVRASVDINVSDQYGWTALMCAVEGGHSSLVKFLLSRGADPSQMEKSKMTAVDIAHKCKRPHLADLIEKWHDSEGPDIANHRNEVKEHGPAESEVYFCPTCKSEYSSSEASHIASTVHLFNLKLQPKPTAYLIPQHNPGYRMMLRSGWNQEQGLGPEGQGQKFPVKTVLKRDREGLGRKKHQKARITHFNPRDVKAVKHVLHTRTERPATLSKKSLTAKAKRDQEKERKFRRDFY